MFAVMLFEFLHLIIVEEKNLSNDIHWATYTANKTLFYILMLIIEDSILISFFVDLQNKYKPGRGRHSLSNDKIVCHCLQGKLIILILLQSYC